jgi:hypothetical protein
VRQSASGGKAAPDEANHRHCEKGAALSRDHKNEGGGIDGIDPDAEIARHRAEQEAQERIARQEAERAERLRREREGK